MLKVLTPNQVDGYHRDGLLFPLPALSAAEVEYFRACHDQLDQQLGGQPTAVEKGDRHLDVKWICDLATHAAVLDAVEDIIGPDILIHSSTIFTKYTKRCGSDWRRRADTSMRSTVAPMGQTTNAIAENPRLEC